MSERAHLEARLRELIAALRDEAATLTEILMIDHHVPEAMRERVRFHRSPLRKLTLRDAHGRQNSDPRWTVPTRCSNWTIVWGAVSAIYRKLDSRAHCLGVLKFGYC
jgi:hypothetical protein